MIDEIALAQYLDKHLPGPTGPISLRQVGQGHSNLTYLIERGESEKHQFILRRPPPGPLLPTTHDMTREYTFITGLANTSLPVPRPLLLCEDSSILGVTFYLMEYLPGIVINEQAPVFLDNRAGRASIAEATIQTLAALHSVDYAAAGLSKIGKPAGYLERQVRRRAEQLAQTLPQTRPLPLMEKLSQWLHDHLPEPASSAIVHGDFRIDNMIFAAHAPAQVLGVLDWETATLGDPLVDLGYLLAFWAAPGETVLSTALGMTRLTALEGFPERPAMAQRYRELTGCTLERPNYYAAFSLWKLAISLEGGYARYLAGMNADPFYITVKEYVPALAERAWQFCRKDELS